MTNNCRFCYCHGGQGWIQIMPLHQPDEMANRL